MRGRWSFGAVVAIAVAIAAAMAGHSRATPVRHASPPVEVTLALQPDGASVRIGAHQPRRLRRRFEILRRQ